ncbi:hypothetical protein PG999_007566 [Apiospora kogelbergensis]|uniref:Rhodopsin domain-containing protein n=1 Tax=Apiospora kogelbergensis TaxID=1337665 RepID=A0AAW0QMQ0_9PEZI
MAANPSHADATKSLIGLIGFYDNLHETKPVSNYPETIIALAVTFLAITWACVCFRIYTRLRIIYAPGWDDVFVVLVLVATRHGMGEHFLLISAEDRITYLKFFYVANVTYCMSTAFVKLSLLFQYLRIFESGGMRMLCKVVMVITAAWGLAYSFMAIVPCFPIQKYWTLTLPGSCYAFGSLVPSVFYATYASSAAINMTLDIVVLCIPIPVYFGANTPFRSKMGLIGLFCMGIIINFISIWRVKSIVDHRAATFPTFDPTWYGPISIELATLEVNFASICASIPVFWPVLTARLDKVFVTREIKIERIHRFEAVDEDRCADDDKYGDDIELQRTRTADSRTDDFGGHGQIHYHPHESSNNSNSHNNNNNPHSRSTSQTSLQQTQSNKQRYGPGGSNMHYMDEYVAAQVDPLSSMGKVELEISAQPMSRKTSREMSRKNSRAQMLRKPSKN